MRRYNSNFPVGYAIVAVDKDMHSYLNYSVHRKPPWAKQIHPGRGRTCCRGASATAIELLAEELGYTVVDVVPRLDLFLVRTDLARRAGLVPLDLSTSSVQVNINAPLTRPETEFLIDYRIWRAAGGGDGGHLRIGVHEAHKAVLQELASISSYSNLTCFKNLEQL